jgi:Tfp pilus assembly PilM family ATPase
MVWFWKNWQSSAMPVLGHIANNGPIGVDVGDDAVKIAQLAANHKAVILLAGYVHKQPRDIENGSSAWQRWVIDALANSTSNGRFRSREVVASIPATEVFIDHIKVPSDAGLADESKLQELVLAKIKHKLPFEAPGAMIRHIPAEENNAVVIAIERKIVDRHLAIYENANLAIKSICVWPTALTNSYISFFGRRKADLDSVVMLLDIDSRRSNVVICRHRSLLFARSITIGAEQLGDEQTVTRLAAELTACKRQLSSMYKKAQVERLIFLSAHTPDRQVCAKIAKQLEMPAQIGDCLAAVQVADLQKAGIDRREPQVNWATAFGLSLA